MVRSATFQTVTLLTISTEAKELALADQRDVALVSLADGTALLRVLHSEAYNRELVAEDDTKSKSTKSKKTTKSRGNRHALSRSRSRSGSRLPRSRSRPGARPASPANEAGWEEPDPRRPEAPSRQEHVEPYHNNDSFPQRPAPVAGPSNFVPPLAPPPAVPRNSRPRNDGDSVLPPAKRRKIESREAVIPGRYYHCRFDRPDAQAFRVSRFRPVTTPSNADRVTCIQRTDGWHRIYDSHTVVLKSAEDLAIYNAELERWDLYDYEDEEDVLYEAKQ